MIHIMAVGIDLSPLQNAWKQAQSVVCFIHPQTTYDAVAAALGVSALAQESGKSVTLVCEAPLRSEYQSLHGVEQVTQNVGNRNLVISFPYQAEQVDKVSYNIDEQSGQFELIIAPQNGVTALAPEAVQFRQSGLSADVILLFGFHSFDELGEIYSTEKFTIDSAFTVALTQGSVPRFAKLHVALQPDQLSYSEWALLWMQQADASLTVPQATNLLSGIEYATAQLRDVQNARVFESVATLMRVGAQRLPDNPAYQHLATPIREPEHKPAPTTPDFSVTRTNSGRAKQSTALYGAADRPSGERG